MSLSTHFPFHREKQALLGWVVLGLFSIVFSAGCTKVEHRHGEQRSHPILTSDVRQSIPLSAAAGTEHRAVMLQHLESIQVIMNALVEEDYELAIN